MKRIPPTDLKPPLFTSDLRDIWRGNQSPEVRKLLWEIYRLRSVILEVDQYFQSIARVWKADVGGTLVALEKLRTLLYNEATIAEVRLETLAQRKADEEAKTAPPVQAPDPNCK